MQGLCQAQPLTTSPASSQEVSISGITLGSIIAAVAMQLICSAAAQQPVVFEHSKHSTPMKQQHQGVCSLLHLCSCSELGLDDYDNSHC